ncbi:hypothetical protein NDU88_002113 [Pleurodeles waltl]|uniref:Uncharacterized protein n=1 Tax=Pleurodeles waltl TaxID=8319 RepID=A0AAV7KRC3_PLEWA|nr:hypothetical protein NDU88_002113 [Pleurodeles waltl]
MVYGQPGGSGAAFKSQSKDRACVSAAGSGTELDDSVESQRFGPASTMQNFDPSQDLYEEQFDDNGVGMMRSRAQVQTVVVFLGSHSEIMPLIPDIIYFSKTRDQEKKSDKHIEALVRTLRRYTFIYLPTAKAGFPKQVVEHPYCGKMVDGLGRCV